MGDRPSRWPSGLQGRDASRKVEPKAHLTIHLLWGRRDPHERIRDTCTGGSRQCSLGGHQGTVASWSNSSQDRIRGEWRPPLCGKRQGNNNGSMAIGKMNPKYGLAYLPYGGKE